MRLNEAVHDVTGEIFRDGWSRIRGSMQGLQAGRQRQLVRAAAGHRAAVFKAIRGGGTHTKSELVAQLEYLTTKSTHIVDSSGFLDGKDKLEAREIKELSDRFAKRWSAGFKPKLGQTTHMLMSFPVGTRGEDVRDITATVAERFFQSEQGHFDYIIAVHEDRDHPHAHLVLNRRSQEGEFFFLGRNHRFNYDDFRLAMVEEAERYGVRLEATRRLERGVLHFPPRTREVYAAKAEGRVAAPRPRVGANLARALEEIAGTRARYQALAAEASRENREDVAHALFRAGALRTKGGGLTLEGDVYMAEERSFEELRSRYADQVERIEGLIAGKPEAERPRLEKSLNEIQARVAHMQPMGPRSMTLTERPSEGGVYSETNIEAAQLNRLRDPEVRAGIETALRRTGMSSAVVIARLETGAQNAALERQWIADDLARVAEQGGLNLERRADLEIARKTLNQAHMRLGTTLERAGVLRQDGVREEQSILERVHSDTEAVHRVEDAIRQEMRAEGMTSEEIDDREREDVARAERRIESEQRAWLEAHPEVLSRPGEVIARSQPYREQITDPDRAEEIAREADRMLAQREVRTSVAEAISDAFRARYPDMPDHLTRGLGVTYAAVVEARDTEAFARVRRETELRATHGTDTLNSSRAPQEEGDARPTLTDRLPEEIARVLEHERAEMFTSPFEYAAQRERFREALEQELGGPRIEQLRAGEADALAERIADRLDRLYVAKVYLQSDPATANSEAVRAVVEEIADRQFALHRADLTDGESERGETH